MKDCYGDPVETMNAASCKAVRIRNRTKRGHPAYAGIADVRSMLDTKRILKEVARV